MNVSNAIQSGTANGSLRTYTTGLALAFVLTIVPFWMVMSGALSGPPLVAGVLAFALVQVVVHLVFFLHMNGSSDQRWNLMAFLFTLLIVAVLVGGSIWIMYHLNHNMMPMTMG
jgi:cytochrome o ubiquinol oxidase operon protein cyoD